MLISFCAPSLFAQASNSGIPVVVKNFMLPQYSSDGMVLQFIVFGEQANNIGATIHLTKPILGIVTEDLKDINQIRPLTGTPPYPLSSTEAEHRKFWSGKDAYRALIFSPDATLDKTTMILRGNEPAYFRSRELDVDGVGFDADHKRKLVHVRSKVRIVIRPDIRRQVTPDAEKEKHNVPTLEQLEQEVRTAEELKKKQNNSQKEEDHTK